MSDLVADLVALHQRFMAELGYSDAKGSGAYREGMHDGLHFAADALGDLLRAHQVSTAEGSPSAIPVEYGVR
jgi:hypothetical protein